METIDETYKAIEADYQHCTYTERLVFDHRDKGGFARWDIEFAAPNSKGERMHFVYHVRPSIPTSFQAWRRYAAPQRGNVCLRLSWQLLWPLQSADQLRQTHG